MKVAIVYDRVNKWGGAERVLLALNKIFPDAPLYTAVYQKKSTSWADVFQVNPSFLQHLPLAKNHHELFASLMPIAFEAFSFDNYDVVISVTSEAAKGIITGPNTKHICICLTPTRYLWSGHAEYFSNPILRLLSVPVVKYLQKWDKIAAQRPDEMIAISETVQKRIRTYYNRPANIIYPPTSIKSQNDSRENSSNGHQDYFLVVSRLVPYKRIDIAIDACNSLQIPLKIIGNGSELHSLKKKAGPTIEFIGTVSDDDLATYYKNCNALIFPGVEDFGLVMVEVQLYGKPVIALRAGGAQEIVVDGKTGEFFEDQNSQSLIGVLKNFNTKRYNETDCINNAHRFSFEQFAEKIQIEIKS